MGSTRNSKADAPGTVLEGKSRPRIVRQRKPAISKAQRKLFLDELAETCNVLLSAQRAGFKPQRAYDLKARDADFRGGWDAAIALGYSQLELTMLERALHGTKVAIKLPNGKATTMRTYSDRLGLTLLKMHREDAGERPDLSAAARTTVGARLHYPTDEQHYFSGFAAGRDDWPAIVAAARGAVRDGLAETFVWALPQVLRDGLTLFGKDQDVTPFEDVDFPIAIGAEASASPGFSTNVVTSASGHETRNANWQQARLRFDAGPGVRGDDELGALIAFFRARRGAAVGFRFRDPFDNSSNMMTHPVTPIDQLLGVGDGTRTRFDLRKTYAQGEVRRITRPVAGSVRVSVGGVAQASGWSLTDLGTVQFATPPASGAAVRAGFQFDTPVRFAEDRLDINRASFLAGEAPSVPLIEIREA